MLELINIIILFFIVVISVYQIYILNYQNDVVGISYVSIFIANINMIFSLFAMFSNLYVEENLTNILIILQNTILWFSSFIYFIYFSKFFYPSRKIVVLSFLSFYTIIISFLIYFTFPMLNYVKVSPSILSICYGSISILLTSVQWLPQIISSIRKGTENLPKTLTAIQFLSILSYFIYLIVIHQPWYIYTPYILSCFQQGIILLICFFQQFKKQKYRQEFEEL